MYKRVNIGVQNQLTVRYSAQSATAGYQYSYSKICSISGRGFQEFITKLEPQHKFPSIPISSHIVQLDNTTQRDSKTVYKKKKYLLMSHVIP